MPGVPTDGNDSFDVAVCRDRCDSGQFHDCLSAAEHADCRALCASKPADVRNTYRSCASTSDCARHRDCYAQLRK